MNTEDIKKLADLCRLDITEADQENYRKDFEGILDYIDTLQSVQIQDHHINGVHTPHQVNIFRNDDVAYPAGTHTETLLDAAPRRKDNFFKVNKVL